MSDLCSCGSGGKRSSAGISKEIEDADFSLGLLGQASADERVA